MSVGYPKLPKGPSAKGAAEVRNLQSQGGEFQVTRRVGVESRLSDDFSRVKTRPGGYITHGYPDGKKQKTYASATNEPPCVAMIPWLPVKREIVDVAQYRDGGFFSGFTRPAYDTSDLLYYDYEIDTPGGPVSFVVPQPAWTLVRRVVISKVNYWGKIGAGIEVTVGVTMPDYLGRPIFPVFSPWVAFAGKSTVATSEDKREALFCAYPTLSARVDQQGRPRTDIALTVMPIAGDAYTVNINPTGFANADVEFAQMMPAIATENHAAFFVREKPYWLDIYDTDSPPDATRKLWMVRVNGKSFGSLTAFDLTPSLCSGQVDRVVLVTDGAPYAPTNMMNAYIDELMAFHIRLCALPNDVVLMSYFVGVVDDLPLPRPPGEQTVNGYQYYIRIARIFLSSGGGGAGVVYEEPAKSPFVFNPALVSTMIPFYPGAFVSGITHLGGGWVIAKISDGLQPSKRFYLEEDQELLLKEPGTETLRFIRSMDGGSSWSPFTPAGFDGAFELGKMGDITVHRPRVGAKPSTLLVNAWSQSAGAYFTYASKDDGLTWERKGKIAKPDEFMRMDGVWRDVGGFGVDSWGGDATFKNLLSPVGQRFADPTIPNRFEVQE